MNDYNGAYNFGDHYGYRIPDLTVKCKWPVWKSDGTLNKLHPTYKKRMRKHAGEEKYAAEQRAWEGPGLINKGLPTMAATVTIITTGGLGSVGAISGWEYAVPTISATNSIYSAIVSPSNSKIIGTSSTIIDGVSLGTDLILSPYQIPLKIPEIGITFISISRYIHNL